MTLEPITIPTVKQIFPEMIDSRVFDDFTVLRSVSDVNRHVGIGWATFSSVRFRDEMKCFMNNNLLAENMSMRLCMMI